MLAITYSDVAVSRIVILNPPSSKNPSSSPHDPRIRCRASNTRRLPYMGQQNTNNSTLHCEVTFLQLKSIIFLVSCLWGCPPTLSHNTHTCIVVSKMFSWRTVFSPTTLLCGIGNLSARNRISHLGFHIKLG